MVSVVHRAELRSRSIRDGVDEGSIASPNVISFRIKPHGADGGLVRSCLCLPLTSNRELLLRCLDDLGMSHNHIVIYVLNHFALCWWLEECRIKVPLLLLYLVRESLTLLLRLEPSLFLSRPMPHASFLGVLD